MNQGIRDVHDDIFNRSVADFVYHNSAGYLIVFITGGVRSFIAELVGPFARVYHVADTCCP